MATPLFIDNQVKEEIFRVMEYAWKHIIPVGELAKSGKLPDPVGDTMDHVVIIPVGFRVVFSIENQGNEKIMGKQTYGKCRHLSMSCEKKGRLPTPIALDMVIEEFGFINPLYHCAMWVEKSEVDSINVLEPVDGWSDQETVQMLEKNNVYVFGHLFGDNLIEVIKNRRQMEKIINDRSRTSSIKEG
jgi:hypothetical protein